MGRDFRFNACVGSPALERNYDFVPYRGSAKLVDAAAAAVLFPDRTGDRRGFRNFYLRSDSHGNSDVVRIKDCGAVRTVGWSLNNALLGWHFQIDRS